MLFPQIYLAAVNAMGEIDMGIATGYLNSMSEKAVKNEHRSSFLPL